MSVGVKNRLGGMRRISSFVWNDIRKIQKIGNRKKIRISAMSDAAQRPLE